MYQNLVTLRPCNFCRFSVCEYKAQTVMQMIEFSVGDMYENSINPTQHTQPSINLQIGHMFSIDHLSVIKQHKFA